MMNPIGGYFSLELPKKKEYHSGAIKLNTGRNCLEYILRCRKYSKVYIPYYSCIVMLEPFQKLGIDYSYYHIDTNLEIKDNIILGNSEAILYINYFGLKDIYINKISRIYGKRLIVDNTQAFFSAPIAGIDTFYTCRKFFGVPDGAYLYTDSLADFEIELDYSYNRMPFLLKRIDLSAEEGYVDFRKESDSLIGQPIKFMSQLTERIMQSIDYKIVSRIRQTNYLELQRLLSPNDGFCFHLEKDATPLIYPYYSKSATLRDNLIEEKIFVAQYWPNVLNNCPSKSLEHSIARKMIPLPIDQRYNKNDMERIVNIINKYDKEV